MEPLHNKYIAIVIFLFITHDIPAQFRDVIYPLAPNSIHLDDYFEKYIQNSISPQNKQVLPYPAL